MKTYLVTGAAGFIGANFLKYILKKYEDINVIVVDALTYAGNLGTITFISLYFFKIYFKKFAPMKPAAPVTRYVFIFPLFFLNFLFYYF